MHADCRVASARLLLDLSSRWEHFTYLLETSAGLPVARTSNSQALSGLRAVVSLSAY
jgi:hypothetical protein